jgi:hypothetical protein
MSGGQDTGAPDGQPLGDLSEASSQEGPVPTSVPPAGPVVDTPVSPPELARVEEVPVTGPVSPPELARVEEVPVTARLVSEEIVRASLAFSFVILLGCTVVLAFLAVNGNHWVNTKELLQLLLPAETALLGSAVGFYFGTRKGS